eukprot:Nk52_evm24s250 gene=Nk52_evmTU24s250
MKTFFLLQLYDDASKSDVESVPRKKNLFQLYTEVCAQPPYSCLEWSSRNLVAFTSLEYLPTTKKSKNSRVVCSYPIYIVNPDSPTSLCCLPAQHLHAVKCLKWNRAGNRLLSGDEYGMVSMWTMRDHVANSWDCEYYHNPGEGEAVAAMLWLNSGMQFGFPTNAADMDGKKEGQEQEIMSYDEKYQRTPLCGPKAGMGNVGWITVSTTGKVYLYYRQSGRNYEVVSASLRTVYTSISYCDIALSSNDKIIIALCDQPSRLVVSLYEITIDTSIGLKDPILTCKYLSNMHLSSAFPVEKQSPCEHYISHFKFDPLSEANVLIACTSGPGADAETCIQRWSVRTSQLSCHMLFAKPANAPNITHNAWEKDCQLNTWGSFVISLDISPDGKSLALAYADGHIAVHESQSLMQVGSFKTQEWGYVDRECQESHHSSANAAAADKMDTDFSELGEQLPQSKRRKTISSFGRNREKACYPCKTEGTTLQNRFPLSIGFSPSSCCFVASDLAANVEFFEMSSVLFHGLDEERLINKMVCLYEHCMVRGSDWWDVQVCMRSVGEDIDSLANYIVNRLANNFIAQNSANHRFYYIRLLALIASVNRCIPSRVVESVDCNAQLFLTFILETFRSCLDPVEIAVKGPASSMTEVCSTITTNSLDDATMNLNINEFDLSIRTADSLWPLCTWVLNFAIFFMKNVKKLVDSSDKEDVLYSSVSGIPCVKFLVEGHTLLILRELLVYIAIFRRKNIAHSKVLKDQVEIARTLYKFFTDIWLKLPPNEQTSKPGMLLLQPSENAPIARGKIAEICDKALVAEFSQNIYEVANLFRILELYPESEGIADSDLIESYHNSVKNALEKSSVSRKSSMANADAIHLDSNGNVEKVASKTTDSSYTCPVFRISAVTLSACQRPYDLPVDRKDCIRQIFIPRKMPLRTCTRCHRFSLLRPEDYGHDLEAIPWQKMWDVSCICGGMWREWAPETSTVNE